MRILLRLTVPILAVAMLLACSPSYTIRAKDGREFRAASRPNLTDEKYIKFKTQDGKEVLLKQDEVSSISED